MAHAIATTVEYYNHLQHDIDEEISVGFIYGNRVPPLGKGAGMVTRYAISNFCADGAPFLKDFPLHCEVPEIIKAVDQAKDSLEDRAYPQRFTSYIKISSEKEYKTALMNGCPIIITVDWQKDMVVKNGQVFSQWKDKSGGHALVIYGWDKNGWKIQNSWGTFWGSCGRAVWPYSYPIKEAFTIIDNETTPLDIEKPFSSNSKFIKWCVKLFNRCYCLVYRIWYKIKN